MAGDLREPYVVQSFPSHRGFDGELIGADDFEYFNVCRQPCGDFSLISQEFTEPVVFFSIFNKEIIFLH